MGRIRDRLTKRWMRLGVRFLSNVFTFNSASARGRVSLKKIPNFLGHCSNRSYYLHNEDRYSMNILQLPDMNGLPRDVFSFGVYDGHGGEACSDFIAKKLDEYVENQTVNNEEALRLASTFKQTYGGYWRSERRSLTSYSRGVARSKFDDLEMRLPLSFLQADLDFLNTPEGRMSGSTATAAYLYSLEMGRQFWEPGVDANLLVAQVGDCRAILADNRGNLQALSTVHHLESPYESDRLEDYKPMVNFTSDGKQRFLQYMNTRAFGDYQGKSSGITAEPELVGYKLGPGRGRLPGNEAFLVIISDGVSDFAADQEVVDLVIQTGFRGGSMRGTPQDAANELVSFALVAGTKDNCTALVIRLGGWGDWGEWTDRSGSIREQKLRAGPSRLK